MTDSLSMVGRVVRTAVALFRLSFRIRGAWGIPALLLAGILAIGIASSTLGLSGRLSWANWDGALDTRAACLQQDTLAVCLDRYRYGLAELGEMLVGRPLRPPPVRVGAPRDAAAPVLPIPEDAEAVAVIDAARAPHAVLGALFPDPEGAPVVRYGATMAPVPAPGLQVVPLGISHARASGLPAAPTRPWDHLLTIVSGAALGVVVLLSLSAGGVHRSLRPVPEWYRALEPVFFYGTAGAIYCGIAAVGLAGIGGVDPGVLLQLVLGGVAVATALQAIWVRVGLAYQEIDLRWLLERSSGHRGHPGRPPTGDDLAADDPRRALTLADIELLRRLQRHTPASTLEYYGAQLLDHPIRRVRLRDAARIAWARSAEPEARADTLVEIVVQHAWSHGDAQFPDDIVERLRKLEASNAISVGRRSIELQTPALEALAMPDLWFVQDVPFYARQALAEADTLLSTGHGADAVICCGRMVERFAREFLFSLLPRTLSRDEDWTLARLLLAPSALNVSERISGQWPALWSLASERLRSARRTGAGDDSVVDERDAHDGIDALHTADPRVVLIALTTRLTSLDRPRGDDPLLPEWQALQSVPSRSRSHVERLLARRTPLAFAVEDAYGPWRRKAEAAFTRMTLAEQLTVIGALFRGTRLARAASALGSDIALEAVAHELRPDAPSAPEEAPLEHTAQVVRELRNVHAHARTGRTAQVSVRDAYHMVWLSRVFVSMCVQRTRPELGEP